MIYYVDGPYSYPYIIEANSEEEALDKCCDYEQTMYDSWAYCGWTENGEWNEDYFALESDFSIISEEKFNTNPEYKDLVNYDFSKCKWGSNNFCEIKENKNYKNE